MKLKNYIPFLDWIRPYKFKTLRQDLVAGLTVGVVVIPGGMAYGMLAGLPPIYGLYAALIPMTVYGLFGTSRQMIIGPAAIIALLVAAGVSEFAEPETTEYIALVLALSFSVGLIQFLVGTMRLGFLVNFLSLPVITGFISAASVIIFLTQIKGLLGIDMPRSNYVHEIIANAVQKIPETNIPTLIIGLIGIAAIITVRIIKKSLPGALVAVLLGILAVYFLKLDEMGVKILGEVPRGLPEFSLPNFEISTLSKLTPVIFTIALISMLESLVIAKAMQSRHRNYEILPNQELRALGFANILGSFSQAFPAAGSFSRTAVNDQAGAQTGMSSLIGAFVVLMTLLFLTPLFYYLPIPIFASIIMMAVVSLIDFKEARYLWKTDKTDFAMMMATFLATMFIGIEPGIFVGIILSLITVIYQISKPHVAVLGRIPGTDSYRNVERFPDSETRQDILILRFDAPLFFANSSAFRELVNTKINPKKNELKLIVINAEGISRIDTTAIHMIQDLVEDLREHDIKIYFSGLIGPTRDSFSKSGLFEKIGRENFFLIIQDAVDFYDKAETGISPAISIQSNFNKHL